MSVGDSDHSLIKHFGQLEDPRESAKARHKLLDMIAIAVAAALTLTGIDPPLLTKTDPS